MDDLWHAMSTRHCGPPLQMAALIFARLLPVVVMTPIFGGQTMPPPPAHGADGRPDYRDAAGLSADVYHSARRDHTPAAACEGGVGRADALVFRHDLVLKRLPRSAPLVDLARGATMANVLDPLTQNQQSILGAFFTQLAVVLFLSIGGIQLLFRALGDGFVLLRPQETAPRRPLRAPARRRLPSGSWRICSSSRCDWVRRRVVVLLLLDFALAVINRIRPADPGLFPRVLTTKGMVGVLLVLLGVRTHGRSGDRAVRRAASGDARLDFEPRKLGDLLR